MSSPAWLVVGFAIVIAAGCVSDREIPRPRIEQTCSVQGRTGGPILPLIARVCDELDLVTGCRRETIEGLGPAAGYRSETEWRCPRAVDDEGTTT